jgi:hypothetical protein
VTCTADSPEPTSIAEQAVVNPPLPSNLKLILNAKTTATIGAFTQVNGDVASSGLSGSVLFDVSSSQGFFSGFNVLANTVTVAVNAQVGHVFGNNITIDGFASQRSLGLDPAALPPVPAVTPSTPGTTNVSVNQNQAKQLCPGQYGAISLGINSTLNLNGGVYQVTRLTLADGARLEPSEPVVILVSGGVTTGIGAFIQPSGQSLNPMTAANIRIEVSGAVSLGDSTQVRAHVLVPGARFTTGKNARLTGAAWAKTISIGTQNVIIGEGVFAAHAAEVPPPCNDNNACTADSCVSAGAAAFCQNTPTPTGTSCEDGNFCNGVELCDGAGSCQAGTNVSAGTSCADGTVCNGDETCNGIGSCLAGTPLVVNDRNACTADACDPVTGVSNVAVPDGTACSGIGACEAGVCSVAGIVFSEDFVRFQSAPAQCDRWNDFLFNQLNNGSFSRVSMSGTFDLTGVACNDPAAATQICRALHNGNFASVFCDGHVWRTGSCGGTELSVDIDICNCTFGAGHTVRPCTGADWGGVNTETCSGPNQNMTVVCE